MIDDSRAQLRDSSPAVILERDGTRMGFCVTGGDASEDGAAVLVAGVDSLKDELEKKGVAIGNWGVDERDGQRLGIFRRSSGRSSLLLSRAPASGKRGEHLIPGDNLSPSDLSWTAPPASQIIRPHRPTDMDPRRQEMSAEPISTRKVSILGSGMGRTYSMGRMQAIFKADGAETGSRYSISEWWLEPNTQGPGIHVHPEDHVYYVIEGAVSVWIDDRWSDAERGSYILIPGGTAHDFENHGLIRCGFISFNSPGGFEQKLPGIVEWFADNPLGDASALPAR